MFDSNATKGTHTRVQDWMKDLEGETTPLANNLSISTQSFESSKELLQQVDKIKDELTKISDGSWWEWDIGSSLFFWRWGESATLALNGMVPFIVSALPQNIKRGRLLERNDNILKITEKLGTILKRGYIQPGYVKSSITGQVAV